MPKPSFNPNQPFSPVEDDAELYGNEPNLAGSSEDDVSAKDVADYEPPSSRPMMGASEEDIPVPDEVSPQALATNPQGLTRRQMRWQLELEKQRAEIDHLRRPAGRTAQTAAWLDTGDKTPDGTPIRFNRLTGEYSTASGVKAYMKPSSDPDKKSADNDKAFERMNDHIKGSVRDSLGDEKRKFRLSTHASSIFDNQNFDDLPPEMVKEVAGLLAAQVSQGSPAQATLNEMTPKTMRGSLAKAYSYLTGEPEGAGQGKYMEYFKHMIERQRDTSKAIIQGELSPTVATYAKLRKVDPDRFDQILAGAGITMGPNGEITAYEPNYQMPVSEKIVKGIKFKKVKDGWEEVGPVTVGKK